MKRLSLIIPKQKKNTGPTKSINGCSSVLISAKNSNIPAKASIATTLIPVHISPKPSISKALTALYLIVRWLQQVLAAL